MKSGIYGFLFAMWILILIGGGIVVTILGPIEVTGYGDANWFIGSVIKAIIAIILVVIWILILIGGGIVVTILGPIEVSGYGDANWFIASVIKAIIAIILVVIWILVLSKMKNWIFKKEIKS